MKKLSIAILTTTLAVTGCTTVADLSGYNSSALNAKAVSQYQQILNESRIDTTSAIAKKVQRAFHRLRPYADAANQTGIKFDWQMSVIHSDIENAWAMPGGKMAFYTGLAKAHNLTESEIAAIVGHEMAHAILEHSKKQVGSKMLSGIAMQLGSAAIQAKTGYSTETINLGASILHQYGLDMPYSRHHEYEADALGMQLMAQAGYNPADAINVWRKMNAKDSSRNTVIGNIMSTHPNNDKRIIAMQKLLPQNRAIYEAAIKRR
ncbi:M48 family metallopeptidase [Moraxella nasovis]|uniref:M48 family metallopeptidase n=1 Tax=Moraxella nasovis TaxID=2904121 RepID=UPI001F60BF5A|nr:M48 family metallopeptidase [Moraxella nasovis]UNU74220.1 M48 family metallopeptidase [Moraxella nasovis]